MSFSKLRANAPELLALKQFRALRESSLSLANLNCMLLPDHLTCDHYQSYFHLQDRRRHRRNEVEIIEVGAESHGGLTSSLIKLAVD